MSRNIRLLAEESRQISCFDAGFSQQPSSHRRFGRLKEETKTSVFCSESCCVTSCCRECKGGGGVVVAWWLGDWTQACSHRRPTVGKHSSGTSLCCGGSGSSRGQPNDVPARAAWRWQSAPGRGRGGSSASARPAGCSPCGSLLGDSQKAIS